MEASTLPSILNLPLSEKEREHKSRNRIGPHVFLSRFFFDFKKLSPDEKTDLIYGASGTAPSPYDDIDSVDTPPDQRIPVGEISRKAWHHYRCLPADMKEAWGKRARKLNKLPVPGRVTVLPREIEEYQIQDLLTVTITDEWQRSTKILHNALRKDPPAGQAMQTLCFGKEKVLLGTQAIRTLPLSPLVRRVLFGQDFQKVMGNIIYMTKKVVLLHLHSNREVIRILSVAGLCGVLHDEGEDRVNSCCGKIIFGYRHDNSKEATGYVMRVNRRRWEVKMQGSNESILIRPPIVNKRTSQYLIKPTDGNHIYFVKEYSPIRIKISMLGDMKITMNRVVFEKRTRDILNTN